MVSVPDGKPSTDLVGGITVHKIPGSVYNPLRAQKVRVRPKNLQNRYHPVTSKLLPHRSARGRQADQRPASPDGTVPPGGPLQAGGSLRNSRGGCVGTH